MLAMENTPRSHSRSNSMLKPQPRGRSGYEPSDTETEWQESPWHDLKTTIAGRPKTPPRSNSPLSRSMRYFTTRDCDIESPVRVVSRTKTSPTPRRTSKSPYKPRRDDITTNVVSPRRNSKSPYKPRRDGTSNNISPIRSSKSPYKPRKDDTVISPNRNISALSRSEHRSSRHVSPYKSTREHLDVRGNDEEQIVIGSTEKTGYRTPPKRAVLEEDGNNAQFLESSRVGGRSNYSRRSLSVPKPRTREKEEQTLDGREGTLIRKQKENSHLKSPLGDLKEMVGEAKLAEGFETETSAGDIFFSREGPALGMQKNPLSNKNGFRNSFPPRPTFVSERNGVSHERSGRNASFTPNVKVLPSKTMSRSNTTSSSGSSRHSRSKSSTDGSKLSNGSRASSDSFRKFTASVQKRQKDAWFGCMMKGPCKTKKSTPEARDLDEALFIEKAFVVENLRPFWADKHQPTSLSAFTCHKQQAQFLKQLIAENSCPHMLFKGPPGSGKKTLTMALLNEIYGDPAWNISHNLRHLHVQGNHVVVPLTSSAHHAELNVKSESENARYALMGIVKEMTSSLEIIPDFSTINSGPNYKVLVLYEVDKVEKNVQHLIKWITDGYTDSCKIILCCEDEADILESLKSRCKIVNVDAPVTHEVMEVLIQIARKENFELPTNFAAKIATKSNQNLRRAIMALESCKFHNYPFVDEQPIALGWEEVLMEVAAEILADPSRKRLFYMRGKFQKLLSEFVHPRLILQKLVEEFLKGIDASLKRELYYWHAYYEKRLPVGTNALLKLEEFVVKFMSIYRNSSRGQTHP